MVLLINRTTLYVVVSLVMFTGYLLVVVWYGRNQKKAPQKRETYAEPMYSDADINASIIRNFHTVLKRFPTPEELQEARQRIKELVADNAGMLSDIVADYITEKQRTSKPPQSSSSPAQPETPETVLPSPSPSSTVRAESPAPSMTDAQKLDTLLQTVTVLSQRLEQVERTSVQSPPPAQANATPSSETIDAALSAVNALSARIAQLSKR